MRTFTVVIAAGIITLACAQASAAQTVGFKVGPTFSKMDTSSEDESKTLTSVGGGAFVRMGYRGLALQLEALALTKGSRLEESFPIYTEEGGEDQFEIERELRLSYIEVPLTVMLALGNGPYLFGGGAVAFETKCEVSASLNGVEISGGCDDDAEFSEGENLRRQKVDFGLVGGAGFQFAVGPGHLLVEGRYTHGLTNLNDDPDDDTKMSNRSFAMFAGYSVAIGGRR